MSKAAFSVIWLVTLLCMGVSAASTTPCAQPTTDDNSNEKSVSLLIVTGGHAYEPSEFFATFSAMCNVRFQHVLLEGNALWSVPENGIGQYDVVLFFDFQPGEITPEWRNLLNRGRGLIFLHHAIGSFPKSPEFKALAGGHANFSQEQVAGVRNTTFHHNVRQRFVIKDRSHPITCGIDDFDMIDEAYDNMDVDPGVHLLITSDYPTISPAAAWTWTYEKKRVLFLQPGHGILWLPPGHGPSSYQNESFKKLLWRGIQWAAGRL